MARDRGAEARSLERRLKEQPYTFDFFQAARRLECAHPDKAPIGCSHRPADDPVRFCQTPSLAFSPSTLSAFHAATDSHPAQLLVNFFGLLGPNGPMPLHMTEYILSRQLAHDVTPARFLDMFNHRMICLVYRAWACNQQAVNFERGDDDRFAIYIGSLFGIGMPTFRRRDRVPDVAKLHYSGRLACQTRHPAGLSAILADYFRIAAGIEEFIGKWVELPAEYCCRVGESPETGEMGRTLIVGARVWECQHAFRVRLGPMGFADYQRMLPGGDSIGRLVGWVRNYMGDELAWDVQLTLKKQEIPKACLGQVGQLGWSTWLYTGPADNDRDDLILRPFAAQAAMRNAG